MRVVIASIYNFLDKISRALGSLSNPLPALATVSDSFRSGQFETYDLHQIVKDLSVLLGVPKYRTSQPKVRTRKFSHTRVLTPIKNFICCPNCGTYHQSHTICGTCYEEVRKVTNEMKKEFMNYNPYIGEKQKPLPKAEPVEVYKRASVVKPAEEIWQGKRIAEPKKPKESWFRKIYKVDDNK